MISHIVLSVIVIIIILILSNSWTPKTKDKNWENSKEGKKWFIKTLIIAIVVLLVSNFILNFIINYPTDTDFKNEQDRIDIYKKELVLLSEINENSAIIKAEINDFGGLILTVNDDGVDKTGVAVYHCRLATSHGVFLKYVKVIDIYDNKLSLENCK